MVTAVSGLLSSWTRPARSRPGRPAAPRARRAPLPLERGAQPLDPLRGASEPGSSWPATPEITMDRRRQPCLDRSRREPCRPAHLPPVRGQRRRHHLAHRHALLARPRQAVVVLGVGPHLPPAQQRDLDPHRPVGRLDRTRAAGPARRAPPGGGGRPAWWSRRRGPRSPRPAAAPRTSAPRRTPGPALLHGERRRPGVERARPPAPPRWPAPRAGRCSRRGSPPAPRAHRRRLRAAPASASCAQGHAQEVGPVRPAPRARGRSRCGRA